MIHIIEEKPSDNYCFAHRGAAKMHIYHIYCLQLNELNI